MNHYCPVCDGYTMVQIDEHRFRCERCGIEVSIELVMFWSRALTSEQLVRLSLKGTDLVSKIQEQENEDSGL